VFDRSGGALDLLGVRDVGGEDECPSPCRLDVLACALESVGAACEEADARTVASEGDGRRAADARGGSGDDDDFAGSRLPLTRFQRDSSSAFS
jgi:hypothetical protein